MQCAQMVAIATRVFHCRDLVQLPSGEVTKSSRRTGENHLRHTKFAVAVSAVCRPRLLGGRSQCRGVIRFANTFPLGVFMADPRNVAHAKKVTQEKKHQATAATLEGGRAAQPGKKLSVARKKNDLAGAVAATHENAAAEIVAPSESSAAKPPAALEGSLVVLAKLKELEFHSRANLERLAEVTLTVEDELKQKAIVSPLAEVYSAQSVFQTKLTNLIEAYKAECDRMQGESG